MIVINQAIESVAIHCVVVPKDTLKVTAMDGYASMSIKDSSGSDVVVQASIDVVPSDLIAFGEALIRMGEEIQAGKRADG